jgi:Fusaric acid resistance protein-like
MPQIRRLRWPTARAAVVEAAVLAVACLVTYLFVTHVITLAYVAPPEDDLLGGVWAVVATIFVLRDSYEQSVAAAVSRVAATSVSFAICLIYLLFLPFYVWAFAALIGLSVLTVTLMGRPGDAVTAAISTAVLMGVAAVNPQDAWLQPILRLVDTLAGVAFGVAVALTDMRFIRPRLRADKPAT